MGTHTLDHSANSPLVLLPLVESYEKKETVELTREVSVCVSGSLGSLVIAAHRPADRGQLVITIDNERSIVTRPRKGSSYLTIRPWRAWRSEAQR